VDVDLLTIANGGCCVIEEVSGFMHNGTGKTCLDKSAIAFFFARELLFYQLHLDIFSCKIRIKMLC
jgi:hypothetical protein